MLRRTARPRARTKCSQGSGHSGMPRDCMTRAKMAADRCRLCYFSAIARRSRGAGAPMTREGRNQVDPWLNTIGQTSAAKIGGGEAVTLVLQPSGNTRTYSATADRCKACSCVAAGVDAGCTKLAAPPPRILATEVSAGEEPDPSQRHVPITPSVVQIHAGGNRPLQRRVGRKAVLQAHPRASTASWKSTGRAELQGHWVVNSTDKSGGKLR